MPDNRFVLTFGGGVNGRRRVADIQPDECVPQSFNFELDPQNRALFRRKPFNLVGTATNGERINGFAQLIKQDGTISQLVQAGDTVYSWDGAAAFTSVGTVSSLTRLRGPREHNFTLDEYVVITDLARQTEVKKWDGTDFKNLDHDLGSSLIAKYCRVYNERVFLANIKTTTDTPHILLASEGSDGEKFSIADRPTSSLSAESPWFLPTPDLRPINGLDEAFGTFILSTLRGRLYILSGRDSFTYSIDPLYIGSAVVGDEAIKNIGNDVILGLAGRIETLSGTLNFGDVESDDLSIWIAPLVEKVTSWTIEYDRRGQRVFCFPNDQSAVWVMYKTILSDPTLEGRMSPWSKWTTTHAIGFQPTTVMQLVDPLNLEDTIYFGDEDGNIYRIDGDVGQDGGTEDINVLRRSGLFAIPEGNTFDIKGWILYRPTIETVVTLRLLFGGVAISEQEIELTLPTNPDVSFYNGDSFYNDGTSHYGTSFTTRIHRQDWRAAGHASHFQIEVEFTGSSEVDLEEVGIEWVSEET